MQVAQLNLSCELNHWIHTCSMIKSDNFLDFVPQTVGFPEATPELVLLLEGELKILYDNQTYLVRNSCFFTFIDKPIVIIPSSRVHLIKITFRSFGVFPIKQLSSISAGELTGCPVVDAHTALGYDCKLLEDKIYSSKTIVEIEGHLSEFLVKRFNSSDLEYLDRAILNQTGTGIYSVDDLCSMLCVTPRTLQRWFAQNMDISPKLYLKLIRLKSLIDDLSIATQRTNYTALALKNGFYDQNHMIKEIKQFTCQTPKMINFESYLPVQLIEI